MAESAGEARDGFCSAFSFVTTRCRSAPTKSQGFLNHGEHQSNHPSHIITAAKGAAVCLLCVYVQKAYRILGGSDCCPARSVLSIHHFLKLLIHEVDCGLDNTPGVAAAVTILLFHGAFTLSITVLLLFNVPCRTVIHLTPLSTRLCFRFFYLAMCNTHALRKKQKRKFKTELEKREKRQTCEISQPTFVMIKVLWFFFFRSRSDQRGFCT